MIFGQTITHSELIEKAARWLERNGHSVVITDMAHSGPETPDAIGWRGMYSTLVECKISKADFRADADKSFRRMPDTGMGNARYFCTPIGLIQTDAIPPKWGLIEWTGKKMIVTLKAEAQGQLSGTRHEIQLLLSALRRVGAAAQKGVSVKVYTIETGNRATLGIGDEE